MKKFLVGLLAAIVAGSTHAGGVYGGGGGENDLWPLAAFTNYGVTADSAYRGDWGAAVSNRESGAPVVGGAFIATSYSVTNTGVRPIIAYSNRRIVVTDAGNSYPGDAWGKYEAGVPNSNSWIWDTQNTKHWGVGVIASLDGYNAYGLDSSTIPGDWEARSSYGAVSGTVHVAYDSDFFTTEYVARTITNLVADFSGLYGDGSHITNISATQVGADTVGSAAVVQSNLTTSYTVLGGALVSHVTNTVLHVSDHDRTNWDGKATLEDVAAVGYVTDISGITAAQVGAVATNDARYLAALTNGALYATTAQGTNADTAWQNPVGASNWTWTKTATEVMLTLYTGPNDVVIPDMLDGLPVTGFGLVFKTNTSITLVNGGNHITAIDYEAFGYCYALTSVSLPSVTSVGGSAFTQCTALTNVSLPSVTNIDVYAFWNCRALTSISFPKAENVGNFAFRYCYALTNVSLPLALNVGMTTFNNCVALTSVSLPSAISIGSAAFDYCNALTSVSLPSAISIGAGAFDHCNALTSISLPSVTSVGFSAFDHCYALTSVSLPSVTSVGFSAFEHCVALTSVSLGRDAPAQNINIYNMATSVTNYITNPTSIGWGTTWCGRPVVRLPVHANTFYGSGTNLLGITAAQVGAIATNDAGYLHLLGDAWYAGDSITNAVDAIAREYNTLTSNAIPSGANYDAAGSAAGVQSNLTGHVTNTVPHVSDGDRTSWDGKATLADVAAVGYVTDSSAFGGATNILTYGSTSTGTYDEVSRTLTMPAETEDTNYLTKIGGTVFGPVYSTSSSSLIGGSPQQDELPTAGWIRNLFSASGEAFYSTTNIMEAAWSTNNYACSTVTQTAFSRIYTTPTNAQYLGWVSTTNRVSYLGGNVIVVNAYLSRQGGSGSPTVSLHPEIYFSTGTGALLGDCDAEPRTIATGTNLYQWVIPIPPQLFTNLVYIIRAFKIDAITGTTRPNVMVLGGGTYPSSFMVSGLSAGQGYIYEAPSDGGLYGRKNQSWTAALAIDGNGVGITNLNAENLASGILPFGRLTTNSIPGGLSFFVTDGTNRWYTRDGSSFTNIVPSGGSTVLTPYQSYTDTVTPDAGGTATVAYANGTLIKIIAVTSPTTITFDNLDFPTNGVSRVCVELWSYTNSIAFSTTIKPSTSTLMLSTTNWTSLFFRRSGNATWRWRQ